MSHPVRSRPPSRRRDRSLTITSHHHQERRARDFKKSRTSRCSPTIQNSIQDSHHQHHSMASNPHTSSGQKSCSHTSRSLTIKSSSRSFKRSQVTRMSSQRMFSSREFCQRSLNRSRPRTSELEAITSGARSEADPASELESEVRVKNAINVLNEKKASKESTLMQADNFLRYVLLHSTSGDPNIMVRRVMRTSSSDSDVVTGLEIWRQMAVTYAGSAQTRVATLLKQIVTPTEWNPEESAKVLQKYHHWLELISKYVTSIRKDIVEHQETSRARYQRRIQ